MNGKGKNKGTKKDMTMKKEENGGETVGNTNI